MHSRLPENAKIKRPIAFGVMIVGRGEVAGSGESGEKTREEGFTGLAGKLLNSDFQDSLDDKEDIRSSHEYLNDLEEEYQAGALLAKSKRFFKKGNQRFSSAKATDQTECYKYGKKDDNEMVVVKVFMVLAEENNVVNKEGAKNGKWVKISMRKVHTLLEMETDDTKVSIHGVKRPWLSKAESFILPNHDTGRILLAESQRNITNLSVAVTDFLVTDYDSEGESSVYSTPLHQLKKLHGAEPISGAKTIKSILRSKSTFKAKTLKGVIVNEPSSAIAKSNKNSSASVVNLAPAGKLKSVKIKDDPPLAIYDIRKPIWYLGSGCSRHMTGVKSYLYKYKEQPGSKVVFRDDSTYTTEGYGSFKCNGIVFIKFDENKGIIFNSNTEIVMIAPRVRDVYVLDMTSSTQESCFFATACDNLNWLWHTRLAHLYFKTINKLAKQNFVIGLPLLVYTKDKPCSSCEKGKHHRASFKTKHTFSIKKCLYLLHMDLFRLVTPRSINHEKYTLVIVDEYSRISQNFSSPYTSEQNGVAKRKNRTLIEAARTMLSGSVFSKQYWSEAVVTACYTQNRSTIVKRHLKTPYEIFYHLGKFDEKANDGYLLGYSLVSNLESSTQEDNKLNKPITSHLMKALMLSNSQNLQLTTSTLLKVKDIHLMNIFIPTSLLKVQDYNQQDDIVYDETFAPVARLVAIRIFLSFSTYMNFIVYQMDVKSAFLSGKLKEEVYVKQPLGHDLSGKAVNETQYRGMIGSLMYLTASKPLEMDTQETDKNQGKNDKTKHKIEKIRKDKVIRSRKSKVKARGQQKSTPG
uniref:Integrase catalytic domain-containing protein n=1 Tax=Tanacetum cinerariifolium TaxID=118510 RepID=A0A6L2JAJ4_TANCI|nr:hypothetical protein [Tanacetum cinerariifolium]